MNNIASFPESEMGIAENVRRNMLPVRPWGSTVWRAFYGHPASIVLS
jgi:hypothetical protein